MKKILALAIVIIMTLSITACSSNTDNQVSEEPTVDEPVVEQSMVCLLYTSDAADEL